MRIENWKLGIALLAVVALSACHKGSGHGPGGEGTVLPTVPVRIQKAESKKLVSTEEAVGTIRARTRAMLEAKVSGRLVELPVKLGQNVKAGELVARLEAAEIRARLEQAKAGLEQAERDFKRAAGLFEQQALTRSEYEAAESRLRVAKAAVQEAEAMTTYVEVRAPFDGVITRKYVDVGDLAAPGKPLVALEDPSVLQLEADVPEAVAGGLKVGAQVAVRADAPANEISATVSEKAPSADPVSRTFQVKVDLPQGQNLLPGQFARLVIPVGERNSLRVPVSAVVERGQLAIVFVAQDQRAQLHLVKTGRRVGDEVEILSGLDSGDAVVVQGANQLRDGQPVTLQ